MRAIASWRIALPVDLACRKRRLAVNLPAAMVPPAAPPFQIESLQKEVD